MYEIFKKVAFLLDAESAHEKTLWLAKSFPFAAKLFSKENLANSKKYSLSVGGVEWCFPVGLAAGLDKNGEAVDFFGGLPFGAVEIGTVTPKPQYGNDRPRLFRYPVDESLRNRMGFNNGGMEKVFKNIIKRNSSKVLGVNLGKNKVTPNEKAFEDYEALYSKFASVCDYLVINVSSPNTPGLRDLQRGDSLDVILESLKKLRSERPRPLFVKVSPDMEEEQYKEIVETAREHNLSGIIATNTTRIESMGDGGVSGKLIYKKAKEKREVLLRLLRGTKLDLIGVGGFSSFEEIFEYWKSGGRAVQIYTSFIYQGPDILNDIREGIDQKLEEYECKTLEDLLQKIQT